MSINKGNIKYPKFRNLNYKELKRNGKKRNDITIASSLNEFTLGACQKTSLLPTVLSALRAKGKVYKAAVSAGWNFN